MRIPCRQAEILQGLRKKEGVELIHETIIQRGKVFEAVRTGFLNRLKKKNLCSGRVAPVSGSVAPSYSCRKARLKCNEPGARRTAAPHIRSSRILQEASWQPGTRRTVSPEPQMGLTGLDPRSRCPHLTEVLEILRQLYWTPLARQAGRSIRREAKDR